MIQQTQTSSLLWQKHLNTKNVEKTKELIEEVVVEKARHQHRERRCWDVFQQHKSTTCFPFIYLLTGYEFKRLFNEKNVIILQDRKDNSICFSHPKTKRKTSIWKSCSYLRLLFQIYCFSLLAKKNSLTCGSQEGKYQTGHIRQTVPTRISTKGRSIITRTRHNIQTDKKGLS